MEQGPELQARMAEVKRLRQRGWSFEDIEAHLKRQSAQLIAEAIAAVREAECKAASRERAGKGAKAPAKPKRSAKPAHYVVQPTGCAVVNLAPATPW
jgi:hypothetical protein